MAQANFFFFVFLAVVVAVRTFLFFKPIKSPTVRGVRLHHYMYGIALLVVAAIFQHVTLYGIGFALFIDEVPFLILRGKNHEDNYSPKAFLMLLGLIFFVYLFRNTIVFW